MVGLVLVSHSPELAKAAAEVAQVLAGPDVKIVPAGGTDDGRLGTSIDLIRAAVREADDGTGVVVLMDVGSSVLTAKTFLIEIEGDDSWPDLRLVDAPFIEGTIAAAVIASTGQDIDRVKESAEEAWAMRKL